MSYGKPDILILRKSHKKNVKPNICKMPMTPEILQLIKDFSPVEFKKLLDLYRKSIKYINITNDKTVIDTIKKLIKGIKSTRKPKCKCHHKCCCRKHHHDTDPSILIGKQRVLVKRPPLVYPIVPVVGAKSNLMAIAPSWIPFYSAAESEQDKNITL